MPADSHLIIKAEYKILFCKQAHINIIHFKEKYFTQFKTRVRNWPWILLYAMEKIKLLSKLISLGNPLGIELGLLSEDNINCRIVQVL